MKQLLLLVVFITFALFSCSNESNHTLDHETDTNPVNSKFLVSSYVRGNFYNAGRISAASLNACTDIICIGATLDVDGGLTFDTYELHNGEGVTTYPALIASIKSKLTGNTSIRLGVSGGVYWKEVIANSTALDKFVQDVNRTIETLDLDGVDLDFEWAENQTEYDNYSNAIVALSNVLSSDVVFSITLDPISYKISSNAINAVNYISLQCYGPSPVRFSYDNYVSSIQSLISYGIPPSKIVPGLPFYGVTADDSRKTVAYKVLVDNGLIDSPTINEVSYNGENYLFNGQDLIKQKVNYAMDQDFYGVMSWSLGTDVDYTNQWSLLRSVKSCLNQQ